MRAVAWPNGQSRRHIDLTLDELLAGLVDCILGAVAQRARQPVVAIGRELGAHAEQCRDESSLERIAPMVIGAVLQSRHAGRVGAWLPVQQDRSPAGEDKPVPSK